MRSIFFKMLCNWLPNKPEWFFDWWTYHLHRLELRLQDESNERRKLRIKRLCKKKGHRWRGVTTTFGRCKRCGEEYDFVPEGCLRVTEDEMLFGPPPACLAGDHRYVLHAHMGDDWRVFGCSRPYCHETITVTVPYGCLEVCEDEIL